MIGKDQKINIPDRADLLPIIRSGPAVGALLVEPMNFISALIKSDSDMSLQEKCRDLYSSWKDIILFFMGLVLLFIPIVFALYPDTPAKSLPFSLRGFFSLVMVTLFWPLAYLVWGFMSGFPFYGSAAPVGWYPQEPLQWAEIQMYDKRYRKYILAVIAVNVVFFISFAGYVLLIEGNNLSTITEDTSGLILCSWMIMMGILAIFCCLSEMSRT